MKKKFIIVSLSVIFFCGCKQVCPGFPKELADFFPYRVGNSVCFVNELNDSLLFSVNDLFIPQEHSYKKEWCSKCDDCNPYWCFLELYSDVCKMDFEIDIESIPADYSQNKYILMLESYIYPRLDNCIYGTMSNDSIIFTSDTSLVYFDSLVVVNGKGLTSFITPNGHKYHINTDI